MRLGFSSLMGAWVLAASACVVVTGGDGDDDTGTEETDSGDADSGDGDGDAGDGDGDAGDGDGDSGDGDGDSGDGDGDSGDGDGDSGDGDGDGDGDCAAPDEGVFVSYTLDFGDEWNVEHNWTCTVTEVALDEGLDLTLDCPEAEQPVGLSVSAGPSFLPALALDDVVQVHYIYEGPWWMNLYLRLDLEGYGHLLTLVDGDSLVPEQPYAFEPRFDMQPVYETCSVTPGDCGTLERLSLSFDANGEPAQMLDGSYAIVGGDPGTEVWIDRAIHRHEIDCTDTPDEWYRLLIVDTGQE